MSSTNQLDDKYLWGNLTKTALRGVTYTPFTKKGIKQYLKDSIGLRNKVDAGTVRDIVEYGNSIINDCVLNNTYGFKLYKNIGFLSVTKYRNKYYSEDKNASKVFKKTSYHMNLHSFEYIYAIMFYKVTNSRLHSKIHTYKFKAGPRIRKALTTIIKETAGEKYVGHTPNDFITKDRMSKIFYKYEKLTN